jgi:hypothetical protein
MSILHFLCYPFHVTSAATAKVFVDAGIPTSTVLDCAVEAVMDQVLAKQLSEKTFFPS